MRRSRYLVRRLVWLSCTVWVGTVGSVLGSSGPALGAEDPFKAMAVQRPSNPGPAPDLTLPSLEGRAVHIKDFRGKVVLLGFFTTT